MSVKERLKAVYKDLNLSQREFEDRWGVSNGYINSIKKSISDDKLEQLSKSFPDIDLVWIKMGIRKNIPYNLDKELTLVNNVSEPSVSYLPKVIVVDQNNNELITMVPHKAAAGYLNGYADPEYIENLPTIVLPGCSNKTCRAFEIRGNSMGILHSGSYNIGEFCESLNEIKDRRTYIIVTKDDGIVIKRVINVKSESKLVLISDNPNKLEFPNYTIDHVDVLQIWYWRCAIIYNIPDPADLYSRMNDLEAKTTLADAKINQLTSKLNRLLP